MFVWDAGPEGKHPVDGGPYCPARDAVSETILSHGIWEPRETVLMLAACQHPDQGIMLDIGAQIGWFSLLAASSGVPVWAYDAEPANLELLDRSAGANRWQDRIFPVHARISGDSHLDYAQRIRLAKIDIEGAEQHAVSALWPAITEQRIDHMLIEISPVFADYYGTMAATIMDAGYDAFLLPPKATPPIQITEPQTALEPGRLAREGIEARVNAWHQENLWFAREGAQW